MTTKGVDSVVRYGFGGSADMARRGLVASAILAILVAAGCARGESSQGWEVLPCGEVFQYFSGEPSHTYECWHDADATDLTELVEAAATQLLDEHGSNAIDRGRRCREQPATQAGDVNFVSGCFAYIDVLGEPQASYYVFGAAKYTPEQLDLIQKGMDPGPFEAVVRIDRTACEIAVEMGGCVS